MIYCRKPYAVEAFRFGSDVEMNAPEWFTKAVDDEKATIDRSILDGAVHVYGCTIVSKYGRLKAKNGDYIVLEPTGEIKPCKAKEFMKLYERMDAHNESKIRNNGRANRKRQTKGIT